MRAMSLSLMLAFSPALAEPPKVVASIPPLHSLAAMVTDGVVEPVLLIPGDASPHDYALRPSEARALAEADLIFWLGETMETPLARPIETLAEKATVLTLLDLPGQDLLGAPEHDDHNEGHDHGDLDPHAWLDPVIAVGWLGPLAEALADRDPANGERYRKNADRAAEAITALTGETTVRLVALEGRDYAVLHDAYRYFERRFGLSRVTAVQGTDAGTPGARGVSEAIATLRGLDRPCLFSDPQEGQALAEQLSAESGAKLAVLDPLGRDYPIGTELYPALITGMADALLACLNE